MRAGFVFVSRLMYKLFIFQYLDLPDCLVTMNTYFLLSGFSCEGITSDNSHQRNDLKAAASVKRLSTWRPGLFNTTFRSASGAVRFLHVAKSMMTARFDKAQGIREDWRMHGKRRNPWSLLMCSELSPLYRLDSSEIDFTISSVLSRLYVRLIRTAINVRFEGVE